MSMVQKDKIHSNCDVVVLVLFVLMHIFIFDMLYVQYNTDACSWKWAVLINLL